MADPVADSGVSAVPPAANGGVADVDARCNPEAVQWAIGEAASEELLLRAQRDAGAELARFLRPGQMVTMEYHASRLNIDLDESDRVTGLRCG